MGIIISYIFFIFSFYWVFREREKFIFFLPLFSIGIEMTFTYFTGFSAPTFVRSIIIILMFYFLRKRLKINNFILPFYVFFLWIIFLLLMSNEFGYSLKGVVQVILTMSVFIVSYYYFDSKEKLDRLLNGLYWVIFAAIIAVLMGYLFNVGRNLEYTESQNYQFDEENIGLLGSGGLYAPAMIIVMLPLLFKTNTISNFKKYLLPGLAILLYIFILLNIRRTAIFLPIVGLLGFLFFTKRKLKYLRYVAFVVFVVIIAYPFYGEVLERRLTSREQGGRFEKDFYKTEMRYLENVYLFETISKFEEPEKVLFGFGNNIFAENISGRRKVSRTYHTDLAKLLYGTGIFGIFLYLIIYIRLFNKIISIPGTSEFAYYKATVFGLFMMSVFIALNGSITIVTFRTISFLLMGAILGYVASEKKRLKASNRFYGNNFNK